MGRKILLITTVIFILLFAGIGLPMKQEVTLMAVGDILLDRGVRRDMGTDYAYPYSRVIEELQRADLLVGNLECPLTDGANPVLKDPSIVFKGDRENAAALKEAGFDILNLANNHTMDHDEQGLLDTVSYLEEQGITYSGVAIPREAGQDPVFITKNGCTIGFLGYSLFPPEGYVSLKDKADVARYDQVRSLEEIGDVSKQCDVLVVSFHWGVEFDYYASETQREVAHKAVEAGADLIVGHHPHVLQEMERYKDAYIFYSLGNFVFDRQIPSGTDESAIAELKIRDKKITEVTMIPLRIVDSQPVISDKESDY